MSKKTPHLSEFKDKYGLVLELALSRLSEKDRIILRKRTVEAVQRHALIIHQYSIMLDMLERKPLTQDILDLYPEDET